MKRIRIFLASFGLMIGLIGVTPTLSYAAPTATQTACSALGSADCSSNNGGPSLTKVVRVIVNILSLVVGIASVVMIIIGGLRYVTSNGDANAITGAKNTIIYALVGLVVTALAQFLVQFVLNKVT